MPGFHMDCFICYWPNKPSLTAPAWHRKLNLRTMKFFLKFTELASNKVKAGT